MSLSDITDEAMTILGAAAGLPPIYYQNLTNNPLPSPPKVDHLIPDIVTGRTRSIGLKTLDQEVGIIQVQIRAKKNSGTIPMADIVGDILALFPRNDPKYVNFKIDNTGYPSPPFYKDGWRVIVVSIPYQNLC